jgi:hypothetical protein
MRGDFWDLIEAQMGDEMHMRSVQNMSPTLALVAPSPTRQYDNDWRGSLLSNTDMVSKTKAPVGLSSVAWKVGDRAVGDLAVGLLFLLLLLLLLALCTGRLLLSPPSSTGAPHGWMENTSDEAASGHGSMPLTWGTTSSISAPARLSACPAMKASAAVDDDEAGAVLVIGEGAGPPFCILPARLAASRMFRTALVR